MGDFTEKHEAMIQETRDTVIEIRTVLLGKNGDEGLLGEFSELKKSHYRLKRNFYLLIGFLAGSGILSGAIIAALNAG